MKLAQKERKKKKWEESIEMASHPKIHKNPFNIKITRQSNNFLQWHITHAEWYKTIVTHILAGKPETRIYCTNEQS